MTVNDLWDELERGHQLGAFRRVSETQRADLYCAIDSGGRPGIVLFSEVEPPLPPPTFESVEISVRRRSDGRWALGLWLRTTSLKRIFALLCQDLVTTSDTIDPASVPAFILSRLIRWRRLLESGASNILDTAALRGLVGELTILRKCFDYWNLVDVVTAWEGPLDAPQDFVLPSKTIEVKAVQASAVSVRINSADQLDVGAGRDLHLAVVVLAAASSDTPDAFSVSGLISTIRRHLEGDAAAQLIFESRLTASGYRDDPEYDRHHFRVERVCAYTVRDTFPRLTRGQLPAGLADISYDIFLSACAPFAGPLESQLGP
jgi:Putative  PD-(D/E)XK family member, (DUF4420)